MRDAGDAAELALERSGYGGGHRLRAGARQAGANGDGREIDLGKRSDRKKTKGNRAGKKDRDGDERSGDWSTDKGRGEIGLRKSLPNRRGAGSSMGLPDVKSEAVCQPIESQINHRRGVQSEQLAEDKSANDGDAQRTAQFGADTAADGKRQSAEERSHGGHHDGTEAQQAGFVDGVERGLPFLAFGLESEVDHHDGVFLDDTDQQNDADKRDDAELHAEKKQRQDGAHAGGGKRGENRDGVDVALVQDAENDVDGNERSKDQQGLVGEGVEKGRGGALESRLHAWRHFNCLCALVRWR